MGPVRPEWEAEACSRKTWTRNIDKYRRRRRRQKIFFILSNQMRDVMASINFSRRRKKMRVGQHLHGEEIREKSSWPL